MDNILPRESSTDDSSGSDSEGERERWSEMGLVVLLPTKVSSLFFFKGRVKKDFCDPWQCSNFRRTTSSLQKAPLRITSSQYMKEGNFHVARVTIWKEVDEI